jgi:hypothetical protein
MRYRFGPGMRLDLLLTIFCVAGLAGCRSAPERSEILVGTTPPGASCLLTRLGQPIATADPTPAIALVDPAPAEIVVQCRRHGFADAAAVLAVRPARSSWGDSSYQGSVEIVMTPLISGVPRR